MLIWGVNESAHDAALSVIDNGKLIFAAHSERYSKKKNDWYLNKKIISEAIQYGRPDKIAYYEKRALKMLRVFIMGGQFGNSRFLRSTSIADVSWKSYSHHYSHAAAGYFTSSFEDATIVVLDAIGEFNTTTVWSARNNTIQQMHKRNYPFSFGLFYSAFTHLIGLKPNQEEYIMMGMAAYGEPSKYYKKISSYFLNINNQKYNFHNGIIDWDLPILEKDRFDIAASVQAVYTERLIEFMRFAKTLGKSKNLVFMGGCALNCSANAVLWDIFDDIWIMPNPGDAGSSLGAALALHGQKIIWTGPYLGTTIPGEYPIAEIVSTLLSEQIAPVASGRAEFGPRAFGNRSILADPRDPKIKDRVNLIKKRELFRPFAPVVLEEDAHLWFDMPCKSSPYMQYAVRCLKPEIIPSVVHYDGTSRVQTVNAKEHLGLYSVLKQWKERTGIGVLLNTSLNIKNQPLLNDEADIAAWEKTYLTKICR
jgi:carbamoyltransferase